MAFNATWAAAAAAHVAPYAAAIKPKLYRVHRELRTRPLFTAETEWPWPDGDYYIVENDQCQAVKEFPNSWQAEQFARLLNSKVAP